MPNQYAPLICPPGATRYERKLFSRWRQRLVGVPDRAAWLTIEELVYSIRSVLSTDSATAVEVARAIARDSKAKGALRSGEAGKDAIYCGEHAAAEISTILAAHPGYTLPSSHDF